MTLLGQKARNHPQQVAIRGALDDVDTRWTPRALWRQLNHEFNFTLDVAAAADNAKTATFFDMAADGLSQSWLGHRVWCNPPFSNIPAWISKAWAEHRAGAELIVVLLPNNRMEQPFWQDLIEPYRDGRGPIETRFLPARIDFRDPNRAADAPRTRPPFGGVLVIWRADT